MYLAGGSVAAHLAGGSVTAPNRWPASHWCICLALRAPKFSFFFALFAAAAAEYWRQQKEVWNPFTMPARPAGLLVRVLCAPAHAWPCGRQGGRILCALSAH